jgi:peptide/nickel transport system permease protein
MRPETRRGRLVQYLIVLAIAVTLNFLLPRLLPGNPLALLAGVDVGMLRPEDREALMARVGLDRPLYEQYFNYLGDLARGDLGYSYRQKRPITAMIGERLPWSILLAGSSLIVSVLVGVALGAVSAWNRARSVDVGLLWGMIAIESLPAFWVGMLFVSIVSVRWGWLPSFGALTPGLRQVGWDRVVDIARHAVLPVLTLSLLSVPGIFLTMRYTMLGVLGQDFIRTARAKGVSETGVLYRHVVRNSLAPVVTVIALRLGFAFGGTVVIETVFSYPGLGRMIFEAVSGRDYPVMQAAFLLFTIAMLISNFLADMAYPLLDPRTRA